MASLAASLYVAPDLRSFELACCNWTMEKHSSVLDDELMEDAPRQSVLAWSTPTVTARKVNAPVWLQRANGKINTDLQSMASAIQKLQDEWQDPNHIAPQSGIVATYHMLLKQWNILFEQQT